MAGEDNFHLGLKGLIRNGDGKILLLRVNTAQLSGAKRSYWDIPGGRINRGEIAEDALRREIQEETGISEVANLQPFSMTLSNIRIPQKDGKDVGLILWVFTCDAVSHQVVLSDEHTEMGWFNLPQVVENLQFKYSPLFLEKLKNIPRV